MNSTPLVSVIIPTFNRADLIVGAIESILGQSYKNIEIIIIDDASTDTTQDVIKQIVAKNPAVRFSISRHETNQGISKSRNEGLRMAQGKYVAMLDSDDVWIDPTKLDQQLAFLESHPDHCIVGTFMTTLDEKGVRGNSIKFETEDAGIRAKLLGTNQFMQSSLLLLKSAIEQVGGYDETLHTMEDHDLWLKLLENGKGANLPLFALGYRIHSGSISMQKRRQIAVDECTVIKRHAPNYRGTLGALVKCRIRLILANLKLY